MRRLTVTPAALDIADPGEHCRQSACVTVLDKHDAAAAARDTSRRISVTITFTVSITLTEEMRLFRWPQGRRPDDHPGLTELGL